MRPIKYPLETFVWRLHDEQGNARVEVRDADRNSVFYISIKGRAFQDSERLKNEIAPRIVRLLNDDELKLVMPIAEHEILPEPTEELMDGTIQNDKEWEYIGDDVELKNGKAMPGGYSQHEITYQGKRIGWLEGGEPMDFVDGFKFVIKNEGKDKEGKNITRLLIFKKRELVAAASPRGRGRQRKT